MASTMALAKNVEGRTVKKVAQILSMSFALVTIGIAESDAIEHEIQIRHESLRFDPGASFCPLDEEAYEFDKIQVNRQKEANKGRNLVLAMYMLCDELDASRNGAENTKTATWGVLLMPSTDGEPTRLPSVLRLKYLDEIESKTGQGIDLYKKNLKQRVSRAVPQKLVDEIGRTGANNTRHLGPLHRDDFAIYSGLLMSVFPGGKGGTFAGISSITLLDGFPVSYSLYRTFQGRSTLEELVAASSEIMETAAYLNRVRGNNRTSFSYYDAGEEPPIWSSAIGFGLLGLIFWRVRSYLRKSKMFRD